MAKLNIDAIAQKALRSVNKPERWRDTADPADVPIPLNWQILCEPIKPRQTSRGGLIELATETQETEAHIINCGQIVAMGPLACHEKTADMDMAVDRDKIKVGAYVVWQRYTGLKIKVRQDDGEIREFVSLAASDLVCIPKDPDKLVYWSG